MFQWSKKSYEDVRALKRRAFQLGMDVGENNHIETVGWVKSELTSILAEARKTGAHEEARRSYEEGKRQGSERRSRHVAGKRMPTREEGGAATEGWRSAARLTVPRARREGPDFVERVDPKEGVKSTIDIMKFVATSPQAKKDLNTMFAGIFDIQERILDTVADSDKKRTFEKGLEILFEAGWVEDCELAHFDEERAVVTLRSTTAVARAFGRSDDPLCQPICNLLETIGRKTFGKSVVVTEIECMSQGKGACRFEITPRSPLGS